MRISAIVCCLGLLALVAGCVVTPSLHPIYTDKELIFDQGLVGSWVVPAEEGGVTWTFQPGEGKAYRLIVQEAEGAEKFTAHLVKLGDLTFLDLLPELLLDNDSFYSEHLLRAHSFLRIEIKENALQVSLLSPGWLDKKLAAGEVSLKSEVVEAESGLESDRRRVLTAATSELQQFLVKYGNDKEAFSEIVKLTRQPAPAPQPADSLP